MKNCFFLMITMISTSMNMMRREEDTEYESSTILRNYFSEYNEEQDYAKKEREVSEKHSFKHLGQFTFEKSCDCHGAIEIFHFLVCIPETMQVSYVISILFSLVAPPDEHNQLIEWNADYAHNRKSLRRNDEDNASATREKMIPTNVLRHSL